MSPEFNMFFFFLFVRCLISDPLAGATPNTSHFELEQISLLQNGAQKLCVQNSPVDGAQNCYLAIGRI